METQRSEMQLCQNPSNVQVYVGDEFVTEQGYVSGLVFIEENPTAPNVLAGSIQNVVNDQGQLDVTLTFWTSAWHLIIKDQEC